MEQSKRDERAPNDQILQNVIRRMQAWVTSDPFAVLVVDVVRQLAYVLADERDARRAMSRLAEQRDNRLQGEIAERSQRQLEITGRLTALERRIGDDPDRMAMGLTEFFRDAARTDDTGPDKARKQAAAELRRDAARARWSPDDVRIADLEAQVAALQKAIDDVWALVEKPDGYGSPFWSEPGLDDTTPAQAVEYVLAHLRGSMSTAAAAISRGVLAIAEVERRSQAHREAMAALNAADRQSDDDQICGC